MTLSLSKLSTIFDRFIVINGLLQRSLIINFGTMNYRSIGNEIFMAIKVDEPSHDHDI